MLDRFRVGAKLANQLLTAIMLGIFTVMITVVGLQMLARWILGPQFGLYLPWTSSLSRLALVATTFVGAVIASRDREHVAVDLLMKRLSSRSARALVVVQSLLVAGFLAVLLIGAARMYDLTAGRPFGALPAYPLLTTEWLYVYAIAGGALMLVYVFRDIVVALVGDEVLLPSETER